jgi:four helix bundle protein
MVLCMIRPVARKITIRSHRDLVVWQRSKKLVGTCYKLTARLPPEEEFGMRRQLRRAAVSVPNNIAEGHGRLSRADYARHVSIARGSLMEVESLLDVAVEVGYVTEAQIAGAMEAADEIGRMIWSLARSLGTRQLPTKKRRSAP